MERAFTLAIPSFGAGGEPDLPLTVNTPNVVTVTISEPPTPAVVHASGAGPPLAEDPTAHPKRRRES